MKTGTSLAQMRKGGGGVIDPPPGAFFQDPVLLPLTRSGNVVDVNLEARIAPVNINGATANLMTYNGFYPAPTIRVQQGDILRVNFTNSLEVTTQTNALGYQKNITNIYPHGWHVSPQEPADFALLEILPGQAYQYQFDTALQEGGTLRFYHPHKHGLVAEQVWGGLAGALVVENETPVLSRYESHILILKDLSLSNSTPAAFSSMDFQSGKEGNIIMVNGQAFQDNPYVINSTLGTYEVWTVNNRTNMDHPFHLHVNAAQVLSITGAVTSYATLPAWKDTVLVPKNGSVTLLVPVEDYIGTTVFHCHILEHEDIGMMGVWQIN